MTQTEIRDLQSKSFIALTALFVKAMNPLTVNQVHPMQLALCSSMHAAASKELEHLDADGVPEDPKAFMWYMLERVNHFLHQRKLDRQTLPHISDELRRLSKVCEAMLIDLDGQETKGGPSA